MSESNFRCSCGEPLYFCDSGSGCRHRIYHCLTCNEIYAVKGDDHYMILAEIDTKTGQLIPMEETEKGKAYVKKEERRLKRLQKAVNNLSCVSEHQHFSGPCISRSSTTNAAASVHAKVGGDTSAKQQEDT